MVDENVGRVIGCFADKAAVRFGDIKVRFSGFERNGFLKKIVPDHPSFEAQSQFTDMH